MKEAVFNSEVVRSLNEVELCWAYKIPDMPHFAGAHFRFDREKPFDIVCFHDGDGVAIEGKQLKKYQAFGHRHMRECQIEALDRIIETGSRAMVFLNIRQKTPYINRLIVFEWPDDVLRNPKMSYKKKELLKMPYVTGKHGRFPLRDWFPLVRI